MKHNNLSPRLLNTRRGSITTLSAVALSAMVMVSALTINAAYLEMAKTDLQTATDLSAKASAIGLGIYQNTEGSKKLGNTSLTRNPPMFGNRSTISVKEIAYGRATKKNDGTYDFVPNGKPMNAVRVTSEYPKMFGGNALPFPFLGSSKGLTTSSIAVRSDNDVCLVLDRSGSMAWDLSNIPFRYPNGSKELENYYQAPDASLSRWAALTRTVESFIRTAEKELPGEMRLGLVTFASDYRFGVFESVAATLDSPITDERRGAVLKRITTLGTAPLIGDTNIGAGLALAESAFTSAKARKETGIKTVVLLSDGVVTQGSDPVAIASGMKSRGVTVHTISFSDQADRPLMQRIAAAGGGKSYHAPTEVELQAAFRTIALNLPGVLIQ